MTMTSKKLSFAIFLPSILLLNGCLSQNTNTTSDSNASSNGNANISVKTDSSTEATPTKTVPIVSSQPKETPVYVASNNIKPNNIEPKDIEPNNIESMGEGTKNHLEQQPSVIGPAQALAIDSKHYAMAYGIDHTEAMRRMLIQHDTQEQSEALHKEFGDRIAGMGFITEPEYGLLVTLTGSGTLPPDRIVYRPADILNERETLAQEYKTITPEDLKLTQADIDKAMALIESPTRFIVKFEVNPKAKNLTEAEKQIMYERSNELNKRITMIVGTSFDSYEGVYVIYVHEDDAKSAGLDKQQLKKIGEEVMKMPVRIEWQNGYATTSIPNSHQELGSVKT